MICIFLQSNPCLQKNKDFSNKKISVTQTIKVLKRNVIKVGEDQATIILDFFTSLQRHLSKSKKHTITGRGPKSIKPGHFLADLNYSADLENSSADKFPLMCLK
ncbi:MAG: hypothetical protein JWP37_1259 [Mucilaginibacter sp.]|nr:hypothetical protein [Mucilaginibacter sp.]